MSSSSPNGTEAQPAPQLPPLPPAASTADAPWWKNAAVLIAALAFVLSLATSLISAYTAHQKDVHDQQAALSAVVEKLLQIPVTETTLLASASGRNTPNLGPVFTEQSRMLTLEAYTLARRLGNGAPAPELMNVAMNLASFENYPAAKQMYKQAASVADNFSDEVSALRNLGVAMIRLAQTDHERAEGEQAFEKAMDIGAKYPEVARNPDEIAYTHALTQLAWTDAWSGFDCTKSEFHLQQADKFVQAAANGPGGGQIVPDAEAWHQALRHCDDHGRLPSRWYPIMGAVRGAGGQPAPVPPPPPAPGGSKE
ncbi:MAG TPA: hypothetical protein VN702_03345 [Acetobacteraceae bacterium]|nr:hypothetical protein [Acetobacteraceae bacterium]